MVYLGKAMANGYPLAAIAGKKEIMDRFNTNTEGDVCFQGTYNAHPLCLVASLATINVLENEGVYEYINELGLYFRNGLREIISKFNIEATVCGFGSVSTIYWCHGPFDNYEDLLKSDSLKSVAFKRAMIERGQYFVPVDLKRIIVTYSHTKKDIDKTLKIAEEVLKKFR